LLFEKLIFLIVHPHFDHMVAMRNTIFF